MPRFGADAEIDLIETGDEQRIQAIESVSSRPMSTPVLAAVAALSVVLTAWLVFSGGAPDNAEIPAEEAALAEFADPIDEGTETETGADIDGEGDAEEDLAADTVHFEVALSAVVVSPRGEGARLVSIDEEGQESVTDLPALTRFQFDPTGRWVAGISVGRIGERSLTLWAGPVGGAMEPIAIGVSSFAWHDGDEGRIGWTGRSRDEVTTVTLSDDESRRELELPAEGRLKGWGDWGYAIETSPRQLATAIVAPDGELLDHLEGRFRGRLPGQGRDQDQAQSPEGQLVFSGGIAPPLSYTLGTGEIAELSWLNPDDDIWSLAVVDQTNAVVAIVARGGNLRSPVNGEVVVIGADGTSTVRELDGLTPVGLSDEGGILFVDQQPGSAFGPGAFTVINTQALRSAATPASATDADAGAGADTARASGLDVAAAPVPDVFPGPEWVVALTIT